MPSRPRPPDPGPGAEGRPRRPWTFLFYLCGDHPAVDKQIDRRLTEVARAGAGKDAYLVVQHDTPEGACRYVLDRPGARGRPEPVARMGPVDTGSARAAIDFLGWGLQQCPADRVAVVFAGIGIADPHSVKGHPDTDPAGLFAFCDDRSARDALDAAELQTVLAEVLRATGRERVDLVLFDMSNMQFLEVAYQLEGLVDFLAGPQTRMPDKGWPYARWLELWRGRPKKGAPDPVPARALAELVVDAAAEAYPDRRHTFSALDLRQLEHVARLFDALVLAVLQSLGDEVVWDARERVALRIRERQDEVIAYDLRGMVELVRDQLGEAARHAVTKWFGKQEKLLQKRGIEAPRLIRAGPGRAPRGRWLEEVLPKVLPELPRRIQQEYPHILAQRERAAHLAQLAAQVLAVLPAREEAPAGPGAPEPFVVRVGPGRARCGVSVYRPRDLDNLRDSNYLRLSFHNRIHWAALLGAINLIQRHPRGLWRLVSAMLATAGGSAYNDLLNRLVGPGSVIGGIGEQFRSLSSPLGLTLSLERISEGRPPPERTYYRLRLERSGSGATVQEQNSRINPDSIDDALRGLEQLLQRPWLEPHELDYLHALGRTLGEDIIENLSTDLEQIRLAAERARPGDNLHLQMQLPRELMRYPWELMSDRRGMLSERYALGRQVFMPGGLTRRVPPRRPGPIRALIIGDPLLQWEAKPGARPPAPLPGAREEAEQIARLFERFADRLGNVVDFRRERDTRIHKALTKSEFRDLLRQGDYDLIHFAGHACFHKDDPESSAWILSDGPLWAKEMRNTLAWNEALPWLVYANACEAGMDSDRPKAPYQGEVFGLATAFINQGVAAYIGPLWPIDDGIAVQMATDFYSALLMERTTLGEALLYAKREAYRVLFGEGDPRGGAPRPTVAGLSWASLVLYGEPGARLVETLWAPLRSQPPEAALPPPLPATSPPARRPPAQRLRRPLQGPGDSARARVGGPGMDELPLDGVRGPAAEAAPERICLELVERNGLRYWDVRDGVAARGGLRDTVVKRLAEDPVTRERLGLQRGWKDYLRVVGRWLLGREDSLVEALARKYDECTVPHEGPVLVLPDGTLGAPGAWQFHNLPARPRDRVLLILHGTFSKTASPVAALGAGFFEWAYAHYDRVIGYDHWTLSRSPRENADDLAELFKQKGSKQLSVDVIAHSRGGLVARALVELCKFKAARQVVFVGTPNRGTGLADPANWGNAADLLVNLLHVDPSGVYGRLSGFLAQVLARGAARHVLEHAPGLMAQNPRATKPSDFLGQLTGTPPDGVTYSAVAANYDPGDELNVFQLLRKAKDLAADTFFGVANDLVVDTASGWALSGAPSEGRFGVYLPRDRLLVFDPGGALKGLPASEVVPALDLPGAHHTNLFAFEQTRRFIQDQLAASRGPAPP